MAEQKAHTVLAYRSPAEAQLAARLSLLYETGRYIAAILDTDALLWEVARLVRYTLDYDYVSIALIDGEGLVYKASVGAGGKQRHPVGLVVPIEQVVIAWRVADSGESVIDDTGSEMVVPIRTRAGIAGVLCVEHNQPGTFDPIDQMLCESLTAQLAGALENARLYKNAQRADELAMLNQVGQEILDSLEPELDQVLEKLASVIARTLRATDCAMILYDGLEEDGVHVAEWREGAFTSPVDGDSVLLPYPDVQSGEPRLISLHAPDVEYVGEAYRALYEMGISSLLVVPLPGRQGRLGTLGLGRRLPLLPFTEQDKTLCQSLAIQAAAAIHNARLLTELVKSNDELARAREELVHSEKLVATGKLAVSIAHEINNPLQAILNCLEIAIQEAHAGEIDIETLRVAHTEIVRVGGIVQHMLSFCRPADSTPALAEMGDLLDSVLKLSGKKLRNNHITVNCALTPRPPTVAVRVDQIKQVFINIILNAIDAMPDGGTLDISARVVRERGRTWLDILFTDTGVGIPLQDQQRVFEPFFTTKQGGTGLGLSVSLDILERHGGTILLESVEVGGTTVAVRLPVQKAEKAR
jgi:signal transduction histidine kinase/putative methionine-R-sulfoxide reductase with GAF domain